MTLILLTLLNLTYDFPISFLTLNVIFTLFVPLSQGQNSLQSLIGEISLLSYFCSLIGPRRPHLRTIALSLGVRKIVIAARKCQPENFERKFGIPDSWDFFLGFSEDGIAELDPQVRRLHEARGGFPGEDRHRRRNHHYLHHPMPHPLRI